MSTMPALTIYHGHQALLSPHNAFPPSTPIFFSSLSTEAISTANTGIVEEPVLIEVPVSNPNPTSTPTRAEAIANSHRIHGGHESSCVISSLSSATQSFRTSSIDSTSIFADLMTIPRRIGIVVLSLCLSYASFLGLYTILNPAGNVSTESAEDSIWIASSKSRVDRFTCKWAGLCGMRHWRGRHRPSYIGGNQAQDVLSRLHNSDDWYDAGSNPSNWTESDRFMRKIPKYIYDYAPLVYLHPDERFWPCDIADHLHHTTATLNYTAIKDAHPNLTNLNDLNRFENGRHVFLTSNDDPESVPGWLSGKKNVPNDVKKNRWNRKARPEEISWDGSVEGEILTDAAKREGWYEAGEGTKKNLERDVRSAANEEGAPYGVGERPVFQGSTPAEQTQIRSKGQSSGGRSNAPAVVIAVDKGDGIVDAFFFFFYSFNLGNKVLNIRFGNHVGDWEHSMIRFQHGKPKAVFLSEHNFGSAVSYEAVEKIGKRPVIYSAIGTHAMYSTPGTHTYVLPFGLLSDHTERGPLWDPLLNAHSYTYEYKSDTLLPSTTTPHAPVGWFYFAGHWGDKFYQLGDERQYRFAGQYHYVNGPLGPRFKNLGRRRVCGGGDNDPCEIKNWIRDGKKKGEEKEYQQWL